MASEPGPIAPPGRWDSALTVFSVLEKVLIVVGVPIAAYWTFFIFSSNDSQKARLRYETDLARARSFGVQADIDARAAMIGEQRIVLGSIVVRNIGAQPVMIDKAYPQIVTVGRVVLDPGPSMRPADIVSVPIFDNRDRPSRYAVVAPQRSIAFPFAAHVTGPGVYLVQFTGPLSFIENGKTTSPKIWGNKALVTVV